MKEFLNFGAQIYNCVARIWKCICRKFEIRASLPFATGIRDFPRREQVGK